MREHGENDFRSQCGCRRGFGPYGAMSEQIRGFVASPIVHRQGMSRPCWRFAAMQLPITPKPINAIFMITP